MPGDRKQFKRAFEKRQKLLEDRSLSLRQGIGTLAIGYSLHSIKLTPAEQTKELSGFAAEAISIYESAKKDKRKAKIYHGLTHEALRQIFTNRDISDVILIGHGDLSKIYIDGREKVDWRDISDMSNHLKQGLFIQRFCGNTLRNASVPFATFAMYDHRNIIATPMESFCPEDYPDDELLLRPVSDVATLQYDDIKRLFPIQTDDINPTLWSESQRLTIPSTNLPSPGQMS